MNTKRILSIVLTLCMVLSMLPVGTLAADTVTITAEVPTGWTMAYCYGWVNGVGNPNWPGVAMTKSGNVWMAEIPADCDRVIITAGSSGPQTLDLVMTAGTDAHVVLGAMSGGKYTADVIQSGVAPIQPEVPEVTEGYYVTGSTAVFGNWAEYNEPGKMTLQDGLYVKVFEGVPKGFYELKVNDGTWFNCWGIGNYNYTFDVARDDSTVTVTFDPATGTVDVKIASSEVEEPVEEPEQVDGYYEIFNADQLYWFVKEVNSGNTSINGKLMVDIVVNENVLKADGTLNGDGSNFQEWTPIGYWNGSSDNAEYIGIFDGNGKTISGLYYNDYNGDYVGLFGRIGSDGVIKNVGVKGSYLRGDYSVGGVVGYNDGGAVTGCFHTGTIKGSRQVGGVVGLNYGTITSCHNSGLISGGNYVGGVLGYSYTHVSSCYNTGSVSGSDYVGGVVGENFYGTVTNCYNTASVSGDREMIGGVLGKSYGTVSNCYNIGSVSGKWYVDALVGDNYGTVINGYYLSGCAADGSSDGQAMTAEQFASGEVAYLLQGDQVEQVWGQAIGTDEYPVLGGDKVYAAEGEYSNTSMVPSLNNGYYEIYNAEQLYWFAEQVNSGETSINGKLMADIVINENVLNADGTLNGDGSNFRVWTPICYFGGTFDGNGKTVSGLYFSDETQSYVGLFGYSDGAIQNVGVVDSYLLGYDVVGGVVGLGTALRCYYSGTISGTYSVGGVVGGGTATLCYNTGSVCGIDDVGGVVGQGSAYNCYNTGSVSGVLCAGGVVGSNYNGEISSCYNIGSVSCEEYVGGVVGYVNNGSVNNIYYLSDCVTDGNSYGQSKTADQFASGEVAYLLQGDQVVQIWGQRIGTDSAPQLGDNRAYRVCDGNAVVYTNNANAVSTHVLVNGGCWACEQYAPAVFNGDYYEIYNAMQLYWFAEQVNSGNTSINGKLMADIVINEDVLNANGTLNGDGSNFRVWTPIGYYNSFTDCSIFEGIFDGNGKTVSGLYFSDETQSYVGLFGYSDGAIQNVGVVDSYFLGNENIGGVAGLGTALRCYNSSTICATDYVGGVVGRGTASLCYNTGNVSGDGGYGFAGGVVGYGSAYNCYNIGSVSGTDCVGGVVGYINDGEVTNCYNIGSVNGNTGIGGVVGGINYGSANNSYYLSDCVTDGNSYGQSKTADQFASGAVAYLLQGDQVEQIWGQRIGTDSAPQLGGNRAYRVCDGNAVVYTNDANAVSTHVLVNGGCWACGLYPSAVLNGDVYEIYDAFQLYWFAEQVNSGNTSINGKLMADIVVNENVLNADGTLNGDGSNFRVWTPICTGGREYEGCFDGDGKSISGLYFNDDTQSYVGLFSNISHDGTVKNVTILDSYIKGKDYVGGVVGDNSYGDLDGCFNAGTVVGTDTVGGVVGYGPVYNCGNTGSVFGNQYVGGVVGYCHAYNCYNTGTVTGKSSVGGVIGAVEYENSASCCYNTGTVIGEERIGAVSGNSYGVSDCYYLSGSCANAGGGIEMTAEDFASGKVAYLLRGKRENSLWGQRVGTDALPALNQPWVYLCCDGESSYWYSNDAEYVSGHSYSNGFCRICDGYQSAVLNGNVYEVSNAGQLYWVADYANSGNNGINIKLMADIVINENVLTADGELNGDGSNLRKWTPIRYYCGTFEGNGKTISGMYGQMGLVDYLSWDYDTKQRGVIQNLGMVDCYISGGTYVGAVVGEGYNAKVLNCYNTGTVIGTRSTGGVVGYMEFGSIIGCYNSGIVRGVEDVGGVVGNHYYGGELTNCYNSGMVIGTGEGVGGVAAIVNNDVTGCYNIGTVRGNKFVGGVLAQLNYMQMTNCYNAGTVIAEEGYCVGGVMGYNLYATISNCSNSGDIIGQKDVSKYVGGVLGYNTGSVQVCHNTGNVCGGVYVGGVSGYNEEGSVCESYNVAGVTGWCVVGGIVGYSNGSISDCYNLGSITGEDSTEETSYTIGGVVGSNHGGGSVERCYNAGTVGGANRNVGGLIGYMKESTVTNSYYLTGCAVYENGQVQQGVGHNTDEEPNADVEGSTASVTAKQLASGEIAYLLQGNQKEQVWGQKIGTEKQPALSDDKVYCVTEGEVVLGYSNVEGQLPVLGVTVSGNVSSFLDGDATVELIQDGEVVYSATVSGGEYAIEGVVAGEYTLRISKANHAPVEMAITVGEEAATFDAAICPIGDVTGDGVVNIKDFQRLLRHVNKTNPLTDYELACGDVTGDGVCNIKDFQRLLRHVNKTNPLF